MFLHFLREEEEGHGKMVDELNDGVLEAEKYTLVYSFGQGIPLTTIVLEKLE